VKVGDDNTFDAVFLRRIACRNDFIRHPLSGLVVIALVPMGLGGRNHTGDTFDIGRDK